VPAASNRTEALRHLSFDAALGSKRQAAILSSNHFWIEGFEDTCISYGFAGQTGSKKDENADDVEKEP
jgi:hypothetical protein